jgi:hypothetical protein
MTKTQAYLLTLIEQFPSPIKLAAAIESVVEDAYAEGADHIAGDPMETAVWKSVARLHREGLSL